MNRKLLCVLLNFVLLIGSEFFNASSEAKRVIINVPYRVKNVKHTHTIYKIIPHYKKEKDHDHLYESEDSEYYR